MAKKVYAIKEGFDSVNNKKIENIIVNTWAECLKYVKGVKGAKYKVLKVWKKLMNSYITPMMYLKKKTIIIQWTACIFMLMEVII